MESEKQEKETRAEVEFTKRPGIFVIGSPNVGKRTLLSRLLSADFDRYENSGPNPDSSSLQLHGWNINTKYYTADVSVGMAHLWDDDGFFRIESLPVYDNLAALVMVFDMNNLSSFSAIQDWASQIDLEHFDILLCMGNKVDLVAGHPAHIAYRRRLYKKVGRSYDNPSSELEYGITEFEGTSLLGDEKQSEDIKKSCLEWCSQHNIEYIEVCASNPDFDKCLSVDGDLQGVERLYGALSAHMWPGMILKSGNKIAIPLLPENPDLSDEDEESDFEFEYEKLSEGSAEPWDDTGKEVVGATNTSPIFDIGQSSGESGVLTKLDEETGTLHNNRELEPSATIDTMSDEYDKEAGSIAEGIKEETDFDQGKHLDFEELDQLMSEIGIVRSNLRLMPDFQRREMAAQLAMKMASMFGGVSDDEEET